MVRSFHELPLLMTPKQLADATGEHVNSIRRSIAAGRIPADKVDGRIYICRDLVFPNTAKGMVGHGDDARPLSGGGRVPVRGRLQARPDAADRSDTAPKGRRARLQPRPPR